MAAPETIPLRTCPFCCGPAELQPDTGEADTYWSVGCSDHECPANCCHFFRHTPEDAAMVWNDRADTNFRGVFDAVLGVLFDQSRPFKSLAERAEICQRIIRAALGFPSHSCGHDHEAITTYFDSWLCPPPIHCAPNPRPVADIPNQLALFPPT